MTASKTPTGMTAKDRDHLVKVVKMRFELLHAELSRQEDVARQRIQNEIREAHAARMEFYREQLMDLGHQMDDLIDRGRELLAEAAREGIALTGHNGGPVTGMVATAVAVANERVIVQQELENLASASGISRNVLKHKELDTIERILVTGLESKDARDFLSDIPKVEELMPTVEIRELTA